MVKSYPRPLLTTTTSQMSPPNRLSDGQPLSVTNAGAPSIVSAFGSRSPGGQLNGLMRLPKCRAVVPAGTGCDAATKRIWPAFVDPSMTSRRGSSCRRTRPRGQGPLPLVVVQVLGYLTE